jgi:hypothetical protein
MARKEQVVCDVCGKLKQETNHWFVVLVNELGIAIATDPQYKAFIDSQPSGAATTATTVDCCGEACVLKKVSELISK